MLFKSVKVFRQNQKLCKKNVFKNLHFFETAQWNEKLFFTLPIQSFSSEGLAKFPVEYLRMLDCEEIVCIYKNLPDTYKADDIIQAKAFRCFDHWPTEGDCLDCLPPFKISCYTCILQKIPQKSAEVERVIAKHLTGQTRFQDFTKKEITLFPLFYLLYNVKGECLMERWNDIPTTFSANSDLLSKLPCLEHNTHISWTTVMSDFVYKYQCFTCLTNK